MAAMVRLQNSKLVDNCSHFQRRLSECWFNFFSHGIQAKNDGLNNE
jgi:hypothetical protein